MLAVAAAAALLSLTSAVQVSANALTAPPARRTAHADIARDIAARQAESGAAAAAPSASPLTDYHFAFTDLPYQVNPYPIDRGPQSGYNQCNSTTEGDNSQCQTLIVNSIDDFCLWGSPKAGDVIGNVEAAVVAYCTKKGHGSRLITPGSITGVQFMKTSAYIQITGHIKQSGIGLADNDQGGELDPHGADLAGNPLGGLVFSSGLPTGDNKTELQAVEWNNFVGGGVFCIKLCDPTITKPNYCENRYDLVGCAYNMPASYKDGEFTSCEGELQDVVGVYTGSDGQVSTWTQTEPHTAPPPYTPRVPASSNCRTFSSAELYGGATASASGSQASVTGTASGSKTTGASGSRTGGSASPSSTGEPSGAAHVAASSMLALVVAVAVAML